MYINSVINLSLHDCTVCIMYLYSWFTKNNSFLILVDTMAYDEALSSFRNLEEHKIASLCRPVSLSKIENVQSYTPVVCAFTVEDEVLEMIPEMKR